ncbi:deoxyribose-phosphate aldolase [Pseudomonas sp. NFACC02]|uniref:deoxyribose-phosphate aldolase n=1 Tax=Pseudomonas sp. NFACC02 TaxID=1566250 RepID=UPI0008AFE6C9|nr:deoxyribose-phosphate aldolase [Pseudomonas sp. NFACC02]SER78328.1 deoxyribose-phosphate aldolase [Pseudomonas sp. NFACC02]
MSRMNEGDEAWAQKAIALLELTSLNADDTAERVVALCERAQTPVGNVAAVCVSSRFAGLARRTLDAAKARDIKVVAAVNFPNGGASVATVASETQAAVLAGADEIDLVYPFNAHLAGDKQIGPEMIAACKAQCGRPGMLTVTLETGVLRDPQLIHDVCRMVIREGVAFLKTSNGKQIVSATPQAARILIEAIAELGSQVGFKASGNVRTVTEARTYLEMAQARFGPYWLEQKRMRLGGSSLLDDLLMRLGVEA